MDRIVPQEEQEVKYRRAKHVRIACEVDSVGSHCEAGTRQPSGIGPGWNLGKSRFAPNIGDLVKRCSYDGCEEEPFRQGLCFQHFLQEQTYLDGIYEQPEPALDGGWWGDPIEEVYR